MRLTKYEPQEQSMFPYQLKNDELRTRLDAIHKLGQLEDIEEEIGIELVTFLKGVNPNTCFMEITKIKNSIFVEMLITEHTQKKNY